MWGKDRMGHDRIEQIAPFCSYMILLHDLYINT